MNRRTFLSGLGSIFAIPFVTKNVVAKSEEFPLLDVTWDYGDDDNDPIWRIGGEPVVTWRWEIVSGYGITPDCVVNIIEPPPGTTRTFPYKKSYSLMDPGIYYHNLISSVNITKCNVREGWIECYPSSQKGWVDLQNQKGKWNLIPKKVYLSKMAVQILSPKGEVLVTLCREDGGCYIKNTK